MIESILHFFGLCSDGHAHFKITDLFLSLNEIRDKISYVKFLFKRNKKEEII